MKRFLVGVIGPAPPVLCKTVQSRGDGVAYGGKELAVSEIFMQKGLFENIPFLLSHISHIFPDKNIRMKSF